MPTVGGRRVLIVDDEDALLSALARAAEARGFQVRTCRDGGQAWESMEREPFDVVVTDLRMPGLSGSELLARIAQEGFGARVIVMTGHATLEAAVDCLRKGAADFLMKPFDVETFLASIEREASRSAPGLGDNPEGEKWNAQFGLSPAEVRVVRAFHLSGKSNRALAAELCLTIHTVKSHLKSAFRKLGASTRAELLQVLRRESPPDHPPTSTSIARPAGSRRLGRATRRIPSR